MHVSEFSLKSLKGILNRNDQIETDILEGKRIRYRSQEQIMEAKDKRLGKHPNTWFLTDTVVNTLKVTATPNEGLKGAINKVLWSKGMLADGGQTKVVEMGGKPVYSGMTDKDNFGGQGSCHLGPPSCNVDTDHDCRATRCVYRVDCGHCERAGIKTVYIGTTGTTLHKRQRTHMTEVRSNNRSNAHTKHMLISHRGEAPDFKTTVLKSGMKYNLDRYIKESLRIEKARMDPEIDLINQRSEWNQRSGIPRLRIEDNNT